MQAWCKLQLHTTLATASRHGTPLQLSSSQCQVFDMLPGGLKQPYMTGLGVVPLPINNQNTIQVSKLNHYIQKPPIVIMVMYLFHSITQWFHFVAWPTFIINTGILNGSAAAQVTCCLCLVQLLLLQRSLNVSFSEGEGRASKPMQTHPMTMTWSASATEETPLKKQNLANITLQLKASQTQTLPKATGMSSILATPHAHAKSTNSFCQFLNIRDPSQITISG